MSDKHQESGPWSTLIQRAMDDPDFRESLIADPRTTITDATGTELPEGVEIVVVEDTPTRIHLILPSADINLNDLDTAGGTGEFQCGFMVCNTPTCGVIC